MQNKIIESIQRFDTITIFRHQMADMDAIGSSMGLKFWLEDQFPSKKIYCLGANNHICERFGFIMDEVEEDVIKDSLAIVLDTSNAQRVDDQRYELASESIRIDHHVIVESFCDIEWIDEKASATCELLSLLFKYNNIRLNKKAAQLLYNGLIADSVHFSISTVRKETFEAAMYLIEQGVDVVEAEQDNYAISMNDFMYETKIRENTKHEKNCLYAIMDKQDYETLDMTFALAKEKVYVMSGIHSIEVWALFTQMDDGIHYSASLRSKKISIREIAQEFGGGGHLCASGIKYLTLEQVHQIIDKLVQISIK